MYNITNMNIKFIKRNNNFLPLVYSPVFSFITIFLISFFTVFPASISLAVEPAPVNVITGTGGKSVDVITGTGGKSVDVITATGGKNEKKSVIENPLKVKSIDSLVSLLVDIALSLGAVLSVLALIWVGVKFILAQGDPKKLEEARRQFMYVVMGIAILFGAKVIVEILKATISPFVDVSQLGNKP